MSLIDAEIDWPLNAGARVLPAHVAGGEVAEPLAVAHDDVLVRGRAIADLGALLRGRERGDRRDRVTRQESGEDCREERHDTSTTTS